MPIPDLRGWQGKKIETLAIAAWNKLPAEVKNEKDRKKAKALIKRLA